MTPARLGPMLAAILGGATAACALAQVAESNAPPASPEQPTAYSPDRLIDGFDFEGRPGWDPELHRDEVPSVLDRRMDARNGFPGFGHVDLDDTVAADGTRWSTRFRLDGYSMSAQTRRGLLMVQPFADHRVQVRVRTDQLRHASARLSAWLHDADGNEIEGSRASSRLVRTGGTWESLELLVPGESRDAVGLIVDLQVLQPAQTARSAAKAFDLPAEPLLRDVHGTAWFDEVKIWQVARIELATQNAGNVIVAPEQPRMRILVRDLAESTLVARLVVRDLAGEKIFEQQFRAPHGRHPAWMDLPLTRCGWYEAIAEVAEGRHIVGRTTLPFVIRPADPTSGRPPSRAIGVHVRTTSTRDLDDVALFVDHIGSGSVTLDTWVEGLDRAAVPLHLESVRRVVDDLLAREVAVAFGVQSVPNWASRLVGVDRTDVVGFFAIEGMLAKQGPLGLAARDGAADDEPQQVAQRVRSDPFVTYVRDLLTRFGLPIRAWQLGSEAHGLVDAQLLDELARARVEVGRVVPVPQLRVPVRAEDELPPLDELPAVTVVVPFRIGAHAIPEYLPGWLGDDRDVLLELEPLPVGPFTRRQQTADMAFRTLHAWRAGADQLVIDGPWRRDDRAIAPTPLFSVWRGLADMLRDRSYLAELAIAPGVHCWMLAGTRSEDDALLIWRDARPGAPPTVVNMLLGPGPATLTDLFGNTSRLDIRQNRHEIPVTDLPATLSAIDLDLAQFRSSLAITPRLVPSTHRRHEHELVLTNPWDVGVTGIVRLGDLPGARITPKALRFTIAPGEELRRSVDIVLERGVVAGRKRLEADVHVDATEAYDLRIGADIEIGWADAEMTSGWQIVHNEVTGQDDLQIRLGVTNRSDRALNLDAIMRADGVPLQTRIIAALAPGTPVNKFFRIPNGAQLLAGQSIRLTVVDRDGLAQLNHLLEVPELDRVAGANEPF